MAGDQFHDESVDYMIEIPDDKKSVDHKKSLELPFLTEAFRFIFAALYVHTDIRT